MRNMIKMAAMALGFMFGMGTMQAEADTPCYGAVRLFADGAGGATERCYPSAEAARASNRIVYAADLSHTKRSSEYAEATTTTATPWIVGIHCIRQYNAAVSESSYLGTSNDGLAALREAFDRSFVDRWQITECAPVVFFHTSGDAEWRHPVHF